MKIGVLTSVHPPTDTRILFKEAATLASAGHEVHLVARASTAPIGCGVHHVQLPVPSSRTARLRTCFQLWREALRLRCDAYHLHDPELLPIAVALKWRTRAAIVFDVHEDVRRQIRNKYWIPAWLRGPLAAAYGLAERICLRAVDRVVVAEDSYASIYADHDPVPIRNYPALDVLGPLGDWERPKRYSGRPRLVYCGTIARIRGVMEMLEALGLLVECHPAAHLDLIGSFFPESLAGDVQERIHARGLASHVTVHGRMPLDRAMAVVAQCDIGLALLHPDPNYLHSLPTKMFEYMALRLPVVVSDFPFWRGIVDATRGGATVDPLSPAAIAAAIDRMASDSSAMTAMGEEGRRAALEVYSWTPEGRRLLDMYRGLAAERGLSDPVQHARAIATAPPATQPEPALARAEEA